METVEARRLHSDEAKFEVVFPPGEKARYTRTEDQTSAGPAVTLRWASDAYVVIVVSFATDPGELDDATVQRVLDTARDGALLQLGGTLVEQWLGRLGPHPRRVAYFGPRGDSEAYGRVDLVFTGQRLYELYFLSMKDAEVRSAAPSAFFASFRLIE